MSTEFQAAIQLFNEQKFFECHEVLEDLWQPLPAGAEKTFLQGLIQVAVGFHHLKNLNYVGAKNKCQSGLQKLESLQQSNYLPPLDITAFIPKIEQAHSTVLTLGPDRLAEFQNALIPRL